MKIFYVPLLLMPIMAFGADEPIFLEEGPSGNFPFVGWIDLPDFQDSELQGVLRDSGERAAKRRKLSDYEADSGCEGIKDEIQDYSMAAASEKDDCLVLQAKKNALSERFKSYGCKRILANSEFQKFFKEKRSLSVKPGLKKICAEWRKKTGQIFLHTDLEDWVIWTTQYAHNSDFEKLVQNCCMQSKLIRMNDVFKNFLLENLADSNWALAQVLALWEKSPERKNYKHINDNVLGLYMDWAVRNESCKELKQLAKDYYHNQPRATSKNKMIHIAGLQEFFDENYDACKTVRGLAAALSTKWNLLHPNEIIRTSTFITQIEERRKSIAH